jgi:hypothetical protein
MSPPLRPDSWQREPTVRDDSWMACILEVDCPVTCDSDDTPVEAETAE